MDLSQYRMAKGGEKVGPSLDDIKWNGFSFLLAAFICYNSIGIPHSDSFGLRGMFDIFLRNFVMMFELICNNSLSLLKNLHLAEALQFSRRIMVSPWLLNFVIRLWS